MPPPSAFRLQPRCTAKGQGLQRVAAGKARRERLEIVCRMHGAKRWRHFRPANGISAHGEGQSGPAAGSKRYGHFYSDSKTYLRDFWGLDQLSKICLHHHAFAVEKKILSPNPKFLFYLLTTDFHEQPPGRHQLAGTTAARLPSRTLTASLRYLFIAEVTVKIPITVHQGLATELSVGLLVPMGLGTWNTLLAKCSVTCGKCCRRLLLLPFPYLLQIELASYFINVKTSQKFIMTCASKSRSSCATKTRTL